MTGRIIEAIHLRDRPFPFPAGRQWPRGASVAARGNRSGLATLSVRGTFDATAAGAFTSDSQITFRQQSREQIKTRLQNEMAPVCRRHLVASGTEWAEAGITGATVTAMVVRVWSIAMPAPGLC
jgi:hypothetical protein